MDITAYLEHQKNLIDQHLDKLVPLHHGPHAKLYEAARYALLGPGKRIRPILTLATVQALGGPIEAALQPACALELIHTYSLIHDDLPAMDDDDYRRGQLTVHRKFNEADAILAGDFLLTYAFDALAHAPHLSDDQKVRLVALLARQSGGEGMLGGQVIDLSYENKKVSLDELELLHSKKTGALISAAVEFGAIISKADVQQRTALKLFGDHIGLAFQIVDDIIDVTAGYEKHGKVEGSDVAKGKTTYVSLLGLDQAKAHGERAFQQAIQPLKPLKLDTSILIQIAEYIVKRKL